MAVLEKKRLSLADLEAQTALELPARETLDTLIVSCLAVCVGQIKFRDINVNAQVAAAVCAGLNTAIISVLNFLPQTGVFDCDVKQTGPKQGG